MSHNETNQPLTELCERAWKLLWRLGNRMVDHKQNYIMGYGLGSYRIRSHNRNLRIEKSTRHKGGIETNIIFHVDEDGKLLDLDVLECAYALEEFRQATILDDLAELGE